MELTEVERQRQLLEENVQKLRQSLKHWQIWEAEYEGLKEELIATGPEALEKESLLEISRSYDGSLVTEKEILDLADLSKDDSANAPLQRTRPQILGLIARRQEYVQKNIETISRQFFVAEGKMEEFAFASITAGGVYGEGAGETDEDEGGLPLTEIHEELDDDGNVVSSELRRPEADTAKVLERLRAAGISPKDLGQDSAATEASAGSTAPALPMKPALVSPLPSPNKSVEPSIESVMPSMDSDSEGSGPRRPPIRKKSVSFTADTKAPEERARADSQEGRKSVSFADKVAVARAADPPDTRSVSFSPKVEEIPAEPLGPPSPNVAASTTPGVTQVEVNTDPDLQKELRASFKPGDKVYEIDEDAEITKPHVVMPENESEEDAQLRREMLDYHLNEVNNVVAQMDLDDDDDDDDDDDNEHDDNHSVFTSSDHPDEDTPYTSGLSDSEYEDEDEHGRTKGALSDEYRKEMEALQSRLIGNMGPAPKDEDLEEAEAQLNPDHAHRLVIRDKRSSMSSVGSSNSDGEKKAGGKKRVSFAEELDVADESAPAPPPKANKHTEGETVAPIIDSVVERAPATQPQARAVPAERVSRFKAARSAPQLDADTADGAADEEPPTGPAGVPMADKLMERTPAAAPAQAPDAEGYDPLLARRELAADYYRRRNNMIKEQGGFKSTGDQSEGLGELMEERDGKVKKVSRFKAARLGK